MVEHGKYMIRSAPDPEGSSEGLATQYAYRRANEVCPDGYDIVDNKVNSVTTTERVAVFGRRTTQSPEVVLMVRCK
jgi:hypothetical protein